jgi:gas vesicle protein
MLNLVKNKNKNTNTNRRQNQEGNTLTDKIKNIANQATKTASNLGGKITETTSDIKKNIQNKISNTTEKVKSSSTTQDASKVVSKVQEFMEANSAISKFVAIVLSILLFYILFNVGTYFLSQYFLPVTSAKVVDGLIPSNVQLIISSDPTVKNSVPILRSVNQNQGLEFTWDVWFFISDVSKLTTQSCIFSKGTAQKNNSLDGALLGVCPGVYISKGPNTNNNNNSQVVLNVALSTRVDPSLNNPGVEQITIPEIPVNKWVHCAVRVQDVSVDIYINGIMTKRKNLKGLPNQNYDKTYVGEEGGFKGYISSLNYYTYALNYDEIQSDYVKGPNMKLVGQNNQINYKDYLAMNWYYKTI